MPRTITLVILVSSLFWAGCAGPSQAEIDATVQAALAATQTAQPTATHTPSPSPSPLPTNTLTVTPLPPTATPTGTPTPAPTLTNTPTPEPTPTSTPQSKEDYIKEVNADLGYDQVNRSDSYVGQKVCWKGKVFTIVEQSGMTGFQAWYFTGRHLGETGKAFVVAYAGLLPQVLEDTEVNVCGEITEKFKGTNAFGAAVVQPMIRASFVDVWKPAALPTPIPPTPTAPPTPLPKTSALGVNKQSGNWDMKLYDVRKAKTVYFYGTAEVAQGMWLLPFIEFKNLSGGTRAPSDDLTFYVVDEAGNTYSAGFNRATFAAAWQFKAGHTTDDINPGVVLGIVVPADVAPELGDAWLMVDEDPNFAIYLGNVSAIQPEN
jgi:hypothetical protein